MPEPRYTDPMMQAVTDRMDARERAPWQKWSALGSFGIGVACIIAALDAGQHGNEFALRGFGAIGTFCTLLSAVLFYQYRKSLRAGSVPMEDLFEMGKKNLDKED